MLKLYVGSDNFAIKFNQEYSTNIVGNLISPQHWFRHGKIRKVSYAIDNGAWISFKNNTDWNKDLFLNVLKQAVTQSLKPDFIVCPDVVGNAIATNKLWHDWIGFLKKYSFPIAFAAQDGHQLNDIPKQADLVFLGGSTQWKLKNMKLFCQNYPTHVARVNSYNRLWLAHNSGAISIDGTGWVRKGYKSDRNKALHDYIGNNFDGLFNAGHYVNRPTLNNILVN